MKYLLRSPSLAGITAILLSSASPACVFLDQDSTTGAESTGGPTDGTAGTMTTDGSTGSTGSTGAVDPTTSGSVTGDDTTGGTTSGTSGDDTTSGTTGDGTTSGTSGDGTTSGTTGEPGLAVNLGTAGEYVILAKAGISTVPKSAITGDLGVSPAASTYITGFSLVLDAAKTFATSTQVTGEVYAASYAEPTPTKLSTAVGDMETAFTDAASRTPDVLELGAGDIGGMTLSAGVYKWGTSLLIPTDITLSGDAEDVWIFQIAQELQISDAVEIELVGGLPENVFWQVEGAVSIGTTAHVEGVVLAHTSVAMKTGASLHGRLLAQTAVTLDGNTVVQPAE